MSAAAPATLAATALLAEVAGAGVHLRLDDAGGLRASGRAPPELLARLREHKAELVELLRAAPAPAMVTNDDIGAAAPAVPRVAPGGSIKEAVPHEAAAAGWDARAWWEHREERVAVLEHDGGLPRREAERRAYAECAALWQAANPPPPCPPDRCACCDDVLPARGAGVVPVLRASGPPAEHLWLHVACLDSWRRGRAELARNHLAAYAVGGPP